MESHHKTNNPWSQPALPQVLRAMPWQQMLQQLRLTALPQPLQQRLPRVIHRVRIAGQPKASRAPLGKVLLCAQCFCSQLAETSDRSKAKTLSLSDKGRSGKQIVACCAPRNCLSAAKVRVRQRVETGGRPLLHSQDVVPPRHARIEVSAPRLHPCTPTHSSLRLDV